MSITRLDPPISLDSPKGPCRAFFLIDYSTEDDLVWVCFVDATGECWSFRNPEIRLCKNITMGSADLIH